MSANAQEQFIWPPILILLCPYSGGDENSFFALPTRAIRNARRKLFLCTGFRVFQLTP
jgi:hypothetical protein